MRPVNFLMNPIRLNRLEHDRAGNEDPPRQLTSPAPGAQAGGGEGQEGHEHHRGQFLLAVFRISLCILCSFPCPMCVCVCFFLSASASL